VETASCRWWGAPPRPARRALGAVDLDLAADDLAKIEAAVLAGSAAGDRYPEPQMALLDSERRGAGSA
jgi:hypothetical protein